MYDEFEIRQVPLSLKTSRQKVERFLSENNLRLDELDYYAGIFPFREEELLGGGGLQRNVIKCIAVSETLREHQMGLKLISHLINVAVNSGYETVRVFTKPENKHIFESIGFSLVGEAPKAIFMEIGQNGISAYCKYLSILKREGRNGVIVMNANPFTKGHRFLIEKASKEVDNLYVIVVKEDLSFFSYTERKAMVEAGCKDLSNVVVCDGSDYIISAQTFPTYFLKELSDASDTQMSLDLNIFAHHIAHALDAKVRFVGTEPTDRLTGRYNELMREILPNYEIEVMEIDRMCQDGGDIVSASALRQHLDSGSFSKAKELVPSSTVPYLISRLAMEALEAELSLTPKPGLVDRKDSGAHQDMDYELMMRSIAALRPYFNQLALMGYNEKMPEVEEVISVGQAAEQAMLKATSGVNTHKGALFALGLTIVAAAHLSFQRGELDSKLLQKYISEIAEQIPSAKETHGAAVVERYQIGGALAAARDGYRQLFDDWLPCLQALTDAPDGLHKTLLRVMMTLDDTNVYYRKGAAAVKMMRTAAGQLLEDFSIGKLEELNEGFIHENISPGGSADMLALTIFVNSILS